MADKNTKNEAPAEPEAFQHGEEFTIKGCAFTVEKIGSRSIVLRTVGKLKLKRENRFMQGMLDAREKDRKAAERKAKAESKAEADEAKKAEAAA